MAKQNSTNGHPPTLTPAQEFRLLREQGAHKRLASTGRVVHWRPVNLTRMLQEGKVPDPLSDYVAKVVWAGTGADERSHLERLVDYEAYLALVAAASLIYPRIVDDPQGADEISAEDLTPAELLEIENMAREPSEEVRRFRTEQTRDVATVAKGDEVRQAAE